MITQDPRRAAVAELTLLTALDVADILSIPIRSVMKMIRAGELVPTKTLGKGEVRFSRGDLRKWIEGNPTMLPGQTTSAPLASEVPTNG